MVQIRKNTSMTLVILILLPHSGFIQPTEAIGSINGISFSTYLGGLGSDSIYDLEIDSSGNIIVVGNTEGDGFPTKNTIYSIFSGLFDVFICKFSPTGELIWSSIIGGSNYDYVKGLAISSLDEIIIVGSTLSTDFITHNAIDSTLGNSTFRDGFITKFDAQGELKWSTYLGGTDIDDVTDVVVGTDGEIYVTGYTLSSDFPLLEEFSPRWLDTFVSSFDKDGTPYETILISGGSNDLPGDIIVDGTDLYVVGVTFSNDFPTLNADDASHGGANDIFILKLGYETVNSASRKIIWSTYLGGDGFDIASKVLITKDRKLIVSGSTSSSESTFPEINAENQITTSSESNGILVWYSVDGELERSFQFGGSVLDYVTDIAEDSAGNMVLIGSTDSDDFPILNEFGDFTPEANTADNIFLRQYSSVGDLSWSTVIGGANDDDYFRVSFNSEDMLFAAGSTYSNDLIIKNAHQNVLQGDTDGYLVQFLTSNPKRDPSTNTVGHSILYILLFIFFPSFILTSLFRSRNR